MTTLLVSDIHLGTRSSQAEAFSQLLETEFDRLIINGDLINGLNFKKLRPEHWAVLGRLRDLARERELILLRGNHDGVPGLGDGLGPLDILPALLGVPMRNEYQLELAGRRYLVLHGDRFDPTLYTPILTDAADWCYQTVQKVNRKAAKWLKRRAKKLGGVLEFIKRRSVHYARSLGCQGVIAGHTHFCDDEWIGDLHYLNTGCWVDRPCTYLVAEGDEVRLHHWENGESTCPVRKAPAEPEVALRNGHLAVRIAE